MHGCCSSKHGAWQGVTNKQYGLDASVFEQKASRKQAESKPGTTNPRCSMAAQLATQLVQQGMGCGLLQRLAVELSSTQKGLLQWPNAWQQRHTAAAAAQAQ